MANAGTRSRSGIRGARERFAAAAERRRAVEWASLRPIVYGLAGLS
jgi:hypothetical protein